MPFLWKYLDIIENSLKTQGHGYSQSSETGEIGFVNSVGKHALKSKQQAYLTIKSC